MHPGFKAVQSKIEGEGYSPGAAGAILASKTRNASASAKKKNPNLKKVKGKKDADGDFDAAPSKAKKKARPLTYFGQSAPPQNY